MTVSGWTEIVLLVVVLTGVTPLLGGYMARVYQGERLALTRLLGPLERTAYRALRIGPDEEQRWTEYARSLIWFSLASWLILYVILRTQRIQPFNT